jgi:hypothetical protein
MPLYTFSHNLLNVLVQIANKMRFKKMFQTIGTNDSGEGTNVSRGWNKVAHCGSQNASISSNSHTALEPSSRTFDGKQITVRARLPVLFYCLLRDAVSGYTTRVKRRIDDLIGIWKKTVVT